MRKILLLLSGIVCFVFQLNAQQFVSTTPANRNVILEEFTGRTCGYCPDGHVIANQLMHNNPNRIWAINIHSAGYFSPTTYPNLNTDKGNTIRAAFGASSFPSGVVNRTTSTAIGRGEWTSRANTQLGQLSELNVAGQAVLNIGSRSVSITVEVYYTGNSSASTNYLTVAMLQDSIWGSQSSGNTNPEQWANGQYCHMHILRDIITDTWGEAITPTTQGTLITKTYTYQIPESIGSPNGVDVDLDNIDFLAWVSETPQGVATRPILSACKLTLLQGDGPFVHFSACDPTEVEPDVETQLDVTMKNDGNQATAGNTTVTISSTDTYLNIIDNTATFGTMAANGGTATVDNAFSIKAAANTPHNHVFSISVSAVNGTNTWHSSFNITNLCPCSAPSNLTATANGTNINLTWTASETASSYKVYRGNSVIASSVTGTSYTDSNLSYATNYCYTVKSNCSGNQISEASNEACATTASPCNAPTGLTTTVVDDFNIMLSWNASSTANTYIVMRDGEQIASNVTGTTYTDEGLESGTYCYTVKSICTDGESNPSAQSCKTIELPCDAPENIQGAYVFNSESDYGVALEWDAPSAKDRDLDKFLIYRSTNGNSYDLLSEVEYAGGQSHFEYFDQTVLGLYFYQIRAYYDWNGETCESLPGMSLENPNSNCVMIRVTSVGESSESAKIYPNPAKNKLHIESAENINELMIFNMVGSMVYSASDCGEKAVVSLSNLPNGVYFIQVTTNSTSKTTRFVKE